MEPKISFERVQAIRPYIADDDLPAFREEWRQINRRDARDGTNEILDAALDDIESDQDYE
jgi:hypothetical protein